MTIKEKQIYLRILYEYEDFIIDSKSFNLEHSLLKDFIKKFELEISLKSGAII